MEKLKFVTENGFKKSELHEAIDILRNSKPNKKKKFQYIIDEWVPICKVSMKDTW
ncbi:hypothetical protein Q2T40_02745 [Winogradskyella maritima]|nr:hypothetical protein [Winogradskyella maritima]